MIEPRPPQSPLVGPGGTDCHVQDMTATFSADLTLAQAHQVLGGHGQWLPIDGNPEQSLGRLVETNSTGSLRLGYGAWRDLLLGCQFHNGRGELITAGGRTVKNVAGYDLTKFMVGQHGVFGRLVTITTRTYRRPAGALVMKSAVGSGLSAGEVGTAGDSSSISTGRPRMTTGELSSPSPGTPGEGWGEGLAEVPSLLAALIPTPLRPHWAMLTPEALWCGYLGDERAIDFYESQLAEGAGFQPVRISRRSLEEDIAHRARHWRAEPARGQLAFRASVPPGRLHELIAQLPAASWSADAAFGIVIGTVQRDAAEATAQAAAGAGGTVYFRDEHGRLAGAEADPARQVLLGRLKHAFDPDNRLNPLPEPITA